MPHSHPAFQKKNLLLLALSYLFYFGQLGVLVPYLGVFLDGRGFSSVEIGELFALITVTRIIGPLLWASMADKSGKPLQVIQLGSFLTVSCFSIVFFADGFWELTLIFGLMMMFWTAILPQIEVLTLRCVHSKPTSYSYIRLWGSIGFIVFTVFSGKMIDVYSSEAPIYVSAVVLFALFISTLVLKQPDKEVKSVVQQRSMFKQVATWTFSLFLLSAVLLQVSFGAYYGFFALYTRDLGYSGQETGLFIALGVVAEIAMFLMAGRLISFFGIKWILIISVLLTALRWTLLATLAHSLLPLLFSQLLHAFSFAMTHAASVQFIHHHFDKDMQSRGQAVYISIGFGVGGSIGNYIAGILWDQGQGAFVSFIFAACAAGLSALCLLFITKSGMNPSVSNCSKQAIS